MVLQEEIEKVKNRAARIVITSNNCSKPGGMPGILKKKKN